MEDDEFDSFERGEEEEHRLQESGLQEPGPPKRRRTKIEITETFLKLEKEKLNLLKSKVSSEAPSENDPDLLFLRSLLPLLKRVKEEDKLDARIELQLALKKYL